MGAWIEIIVSTVLDLSIGVTVAPLVGAWIEIPVYDSCEMLLHVAPLVGAWIEIHFQRAAAAETKSLPLWERGLK